MRIAIVLAAPLVLGFAPAEQAPGAPEALPFDMPGYSKPAPLATGDLKDFVNRYHQEEEFKKRQRDKLDLEDHKFGKDPIFLQREKPAGGNLDG